MRILALVTAILVSLSVTAMAGDIMRKPSGQADTKAGVKKSAGKNINVSGRIKTSQ